MVVGIELVMMETEGLEVMEVVGVVVEGNRQVAAEMVGAEMDVEVTMATGEVNKLVEEVGAAAAGEVRVAAELAQKTCT